MKRNGLKVACLLLSLLLVLQLAPVTAEAGLAELPVEELYGRSILATLEDGQVLQYVYDRVAEGVRDSEENISVYNGKDPVSIEQAQIAVDAFLRDNHGYFWFEGTYSMSYNGETVLNVKPRYTMEGSQLDAAKAAVNEAVREAMSGIKAGMTQLEMELYLHDWLAGRVVYDTELTGEHIHDLFGALVFGKAVCDGYADAFGYLLRLVGIQSYIAYGMSIKPNSYDAVSHAWNYVRINGKYYHTDVTWASQKGEIYHTYFNVSDAKIQEDHWIDESEYPLPVCSDMDAFYFNGREEYMTDYTVESVSKLLAEGDNTVSIYIPGSIGIDSYVQWINGGSVLYIPKCIADFLDFMMANGAAINEQLRPAGKRLQAYRFLGNEVRIATLTADTGPKTVKVSGTVYLQNQAVATGSLVELCKDGKVVASLIAGDGSYGFENVPAGEYTLRFSREGYITGEMPITADSANLIVEYVLYLKGDVSGDGKVNNRDATRLLQYLAGWDVAAASSALDVTGDGKVNNRDATRLLQYLAGWDVAVYPD